MKTKVLVKAYQFLNKALFNTELPAVRFEIDTNIKAVFHYRGSSLLLGCEFPEASLQDIFDDLLHDMIHVWNQSRGIVDFTQNQYHNKFFCDAALEKGLFVIHHPARGWSITTSRREMIQPIHKSKVRLPKGRASISLMNIFDDLKKEIQAEDFSEIREVIQKIIDEKPKKQFQLRYICNCDPPVIIRSGRRPDSQRPLNVVCKDCGAKFVTNEATS